MLSLFLTSAVLGAAVTAYVGRRIAPWWMWGLSALVVGWQIMLPIAVVERSGVGEGWSGRVWAVVSVGWGLLLGGLVIVGWEAAGY